MDREYQLNIIIQTTIENISALLSRAEKEFAISESNFNMVLEEIDSFNTQASELLGKFQSVSLCNMVIASLRYMKSLADEAGVMEIQKRIWVVQNDWKKKKYLQEGLPTKAIGLFFWKILSDYGTNLTRLMSVGLVTWIGSTFIIAGIDFWEGNTHFTNDITAALNYTSKLAYTTFSALIGIGTIESSDFSWYTYIVVMLETLIGYAIFAALVSIISVHIFFTDK